MFFIFTQLSFANAKVPGQAFDCFINANVSALAQLQNAKLIVSGGMGDIVVLSEIVVYSLDNEQQSSSTAAVNPTTTTVKNSGGQSTTSASQTSAIQNSFSVSTIMVQGQAIDQSAIADKTSATYKQVEAVLIAEMAKVYQQAGIAVSEIDVTSIEFQETVGKFVASFETITSSGIQLTEAEVNSTVSTAFQDLVGSNAFDNSFGTDSMAMSFLGVSTTNLGATTAGSQNSNNNNKNKGTLIECSFKLLLLPILFMLF